MSVSTRKMFWLLLPVLAMWTVGCGNSSLTNSHASIDPSECDDNFGVFLARFRGVNRQQDAQRYKEMTEKEAGWKDLYIVDTADSADLYRGRFVTIDDAGATVKSSRAWKNSRGVVVYNSAGVLKLPGKEIGPPEWNASNANGAYTVLIASFHDTPNRKTLAVKYCEQLRQEGEEAWYFHGQASSVVMVGSFPASSIKEVKLNGGTVIETHPADPKMEALLKKYEFLADNGMKKMVAATDVITQKSDWIPKKSYPTRIPRKAAANGPTDLSTGYTQPR